MIKMLINLLFVIICHVKIQNKASNLLFCVSFVSIKLSRCKISLNNYCLNDTIFFCFNVVSFRVFGQKMLPQTKLRRLGLPNQIAVINLNLESYFDRQCWSDLDSKEIVSIMAISI